MPLTAGSSFAMSLTSAQEGQWRTNDMPLLGGPSFAIQTTHDAAAAAAAARSGRSAPSEHEGRTPSGRCAAAGPLAKLRRAAGTALRRRQARVSDASGGLQTAVVNQESSPDGRPASRRDGRKWLPGRLRELLV